jgi:hypothetical protein
MRRGALVVLAGLFVSSLGSSPAISDETGVIQQLPDRPDLRRDRCGRNTKVFHLLPTWHKSEVDPRQDMKAKKSQPFRLI